MRRGVDVRKRKLADADAGGLPRASPHLPPPPPPSLESLHRQPPPSRTSSNNKRIRASDPSHPSDSSDAFDPSDPRPFPSSKASASSSATSLVSNAELELDVEAPSSTLSTLSPSSVFLSPSAGRRRRYYPPSHLMSPHSPLQSPSPSSPSLSVFGATPRKGRCSPSSAHSAFFSLSPMPHHPPPHRRSPRLSCSPLHSPGSASSLFQSPHRRTPRSVRAMARAANALHGASASPSRTPRSLTSTLNLSSLVALPPLHSADPLPPLLSPTLFTGEGLTPSVSLSGFPWEGDSTAALERPPPPPPSALQATPKRRRQKRAKAAVASAAVKGKGKGRGRRKAAVVVEPAEESLDSLAALLPQLSRGPTPTLPSLFSPSRDFSFPSASLGLRAALHSTPGGFPLPRRLQATPSSAASRASTASSNSSRRTASFSIIGATSPSPSSSAALRLSSLHSNTKHNVRQRLTFDAQHSHTAQHSSDDAHHPPVGRMKEEEGARTGEEERRDGQGVGPSQCGGAGHSHGSSCAHRRPVTRFIMSDDGLLEQRTSAHADGEPRSLFAYRASAGSMTPARFPPSPIEDAALSPLRPRSYTFSRKAEPNVASSTATAGLPSAPASQLGSSAAASSADASVTPAPLPQVEGVGGDVPALSDPTAPPLGSLVGAVSAQQLLASLLTGERASPSGVISIDGVPVKSKGCACKKSQCLKLYCECFAHGRVCGADCHCLNCHNTDREEHQEAREKAIHSTRERDANAFYRAAPLKAKAEALAASHNAANAANNANPPIAAATAVVAVNEEAAPSAPPSTTNSAGAVRSGPTEGTAELSLSLSAERVVGGDGSSGGRGGGDGSGGGGPGPSAAVAAASARKGCNCKKSRCLKKYCECFQLGLRCTERCRCELCANGKEHGGGGGHEGGPAVKGEGKEEGGASGAGGEAGGRMKGVFVNVPVESHLPSAQPSAEATSASLAAAASSSSSASPREVEGSGVSKLSTWKLLPSGSSSRVAGSLHVQHAISNAPPIPVAPLAPFSLPAPFELFHSMQTHTQPAALSLAPLS